MGQNRKSCRARPLDQHARCMDLKQFAKHKGLILKKDAQGVITAH
jgi:hypothetical protein